MDLIKEENGAVREENGQDFKLWSQKASLRWYYLSHDIKKPDKERVF